MIHAISTSPRDSQDNKIIPEHDEFNIQVKFCNRIQTIMKRDQPSANICYKSAENGNICEFQEGNIQNETEHMKDVITINITMCNIGHLHVHLLIYYKHGHPQGYATYYKAIIINLFEIFVIEIKLLLK